MADVMVAVMPFAGHVAPIAAVVAEFIADGHAVRVYTGAAHTGAFEALGAEIVPWRQARDFDENRLSDAFPALRGKKGPRQMLANVEELFIGTGAGQCADLADAYRRRPWDVIVADGLSLGAHLVSELLETPWVTVSIVPLALPDPRLPPPGLGIRPASGVVGRVRDSSLRALVRLATTSMQAAYQRQRAFSGLRLDRRFEHAWYSPELVCASGVPELDYLGTDQPTRVEFVGILSRGITLSDALPGWWPSVTDAAVPVVHVTQGTQNVDPHDLIEPTMAALGRQDVLVVATTGVRGEPELPFPVPPNARVADLLPYPELLPRTSVVITNGGWGGVLAALAADIPLVVAGGDLDKPEIARRIEWAGAGVNLRSGTPTAGTVLAGWRRVRTEPSYRAAAARLGGLLRAHDGPAEVVGHTLDLLAKRQSGAN
jgi:UDP:flavonoid glycosyltransferase YjiC (YdhE family)